VRSRVVSYCYRTACYIIVLMGCVMKLRLLLLALLFAAPVQRAMAWGQEGHSIVAELAQRRLTPTAANELSRLLGPGASLASIASWADDYRELHKETTGWHFVNIPLAATNFDDTRDCTEDSNTREGDCIITCYSSQLGDAVRYEQT
jgi:nuclease S1